MTTLTTTNADASEAAPSLGRDLRTVGWLRWRQFRDDAIYWLRVLGYQPHDKSLSQQLYVVYLAIFGLIWLAAMFAYFADMAGRIAEALAVGTLPDILNVVAWAVLIAQVLVVVNAMQSTPVKLTFADMAYLAASPVNRAAPTLLGLIRLLIVRTVVIVPPLLIISVLITRLVRVPFTPGVAFGIAGTAFGLIAITWGLAWVLGLPRLIDPRLRRLRWLALLPLLIVPLAAVLPDVVLLPGRTLGAALMGALPPIDLVIIAAIAGLCFAAVIRMGRSVNMTQAADESVVYARLQALGTLAWTQPQVQARIRLQAVGGRRAFLKLPRMQGGSMLLGRAALSYIRHPGALVTALVWGGVLTGAAIAIVTGGGPFQLWIGWMLVVGFVPPTGLLRVFAADVEEPFLRQFLPVDGLQLLVLDVAIPFVIVMVGGLLAIVVSGLNGAALIYALIALPLSAVLIALIGGWSLTRTKVLQTRLFATVIAFGLAAGAGAALTSALAGIGVLALAVMIMVGMVLQDV